MSQARKAAIRQARREAWLTQVANDAAYRSVVGENYGVETPLEPRRQPRPSRKVVTTRLAPAPCFVIRRATAPGRCKICKGRIGLGDKIAAVMPMRHLRC